MDAPVIDEDLPQPDAQASAPSNPTTEKPASARPMSQPRWLRPALFALLPLALIIGGYAYATGGQVISTENAYVRADIVGVSTDISGTVKEVDVKDNQTVAAGDVLFKLDDEPFRLALTRTQAQIGITAAELNALKASYRDMEAQIRQAGADVVLYDAQLARQLDLVKRNVTPQANVDQAERNAQAARQKVVSLDQQLAGILANLNGNAAIDIEKHPRYIAAVAQRDEAKRQLDHATVRAAFDGIVTNVPSLQPGQYLAASTPGMSVVSTDHLWIEANPKETELTYIRAGQDVNVNSLSPASSSSFSLLPAQNTSGNWVKVVQRIPIRVRIDTPADKPQLRSGMSVVVDVNTGHARGLPFLSGVLGSKNSHG